MLHSKPIKQTDFQLFKAKDYTSLLKKYEPLVYSVTRKFYSEMVKDKSIEFEDICQYNKMLIWEAIIYTKKIIKQRKFNDGMRFGLILKQKLNQHLSIELNKKRNQINRNLIEIENLSESNLICHSNFEERIENEELYEKFAIQLTNKERKILEVLKLRKKYNDIPKQLHLSEILFKKIKNDLKNRFNDFIKKEVKESI